MIRSYLILALRSIYRQKALSFLSIAGLAVGLAACFLIVLFVTHELSYDRFNEFHERIFRVTMQVEGADGSRQHASTFYALGDFLTADLPEVEQTVRVLDAHEIVMHHGERRFRETEALYVEPSFFDIFSIPVLRGDAKELGRPFTLMVTPETARKYFGDADPVGRQLQVNQEDTLLYEVVGVVDAAPVTSHLHYSALISSASLSIPDRQAWMRLAHLYVLLEEDADPDETHAKGVSLISNRVPEQLRHRVSFDLQPLTRIHLYGGFLGEIRPQGDIRYVRLFSAIALLILFIASINYINMTTARSTKRSREVGVRKVVGADRRQLVGQFLGESLVTGLFALVLALLLTWLLLPLFGSLIQRPLLLRFSPSVVGLFLGITLLASLVSGIYPAFILSSFRPSEVLGGRRHWQNVSVLRKGLVVVQFVIATVLLGATLIMNDQLRYIQQANLGFQKEHVLVVETHGGLEENPQAFQAALLDKPYIEAVSFANTLPGRHYSLSVVEGQDVEAYEEKGQESLYAYTSWVDAGYAAALNLELAEGRFFDEDHPSDAYGAVIINETLRQRLGWDEAVGKRLMRGRVIGVVRDFHTESLREPIKPMVFFPNFGGKHTQHAIVRLHREADLQQVVADVGRLWDRYAPAIPLDYHFLDEDFDALYRADQRVRWLFLMAAALAVFVSCLGLFGLSAFVAERRTKEIGIRKVLGATVSSIVLLLSKDFLRLVLVAIVLAAPLAYFATNRWLEDFAYRIEIGPGIFVLAGVLALFIALLTVSYQAIRAALADPVKSLRYE